MIDAARVRKAVNERWWRGALLALCLFVFASAICAHSPAPGAAADRPLTERQRVLDLMRSAFGEELEAVVTDRPRVKRFLSDHAAVVLPDDAAPSAAGPVLLESTVPLRIADDAGRPRVVDLGLAREQGNLLPRNPLVEVEIPGRLGLGIALPRTGIEIRLEGAPAGRAPSTIDGGIAVYPNTAPATSLAVLPTFNGVETLTLLEAPRAPRAQTFELDLPPGAVLVATGAGGATVSSNGRPLMTVAPPTAVDADGADVPVRLEVEGKSLRLEVTPHLGTRYPILVDPLYQTYTWNIGSSSGLADWSSATNTASYTPTDYMACGGACVPGYEIHGWPGLYVRAAVGPAAPGNSAYWSYFVPRYKSDQAAYGKLPTSFISSMTLSAVGYFNRGDVNPSPLIRAGLWASKEAPAWGGPNNWVDVFLWGAHQGDLTGAMPITVSNPAGNEAVKWAMAGLISNDNHSLAAFRDVYFGAAQLGLADTAAPALSPITAPTEWLDTEAKKAAAATAEDTGLGVYSITSKDVNNPSSTWTISLNCPGTAAKPCPRVWDSAKSGNPILYYYPAVLPEGISTLELTVKDPLGNVSAPRYVQVKVDHSAPVVTLSGSLTEPGIKKLSPGKYPLLVSATDGGPGVPRSGVKSIEIKLDGTTIPTTLEQACPAGSCPATREWILDVSKYSAGEHTVQVVVKDQVGRATTKELKITTSKSQIYWGSWIDGEVALLEGEAVRGDAPWNTTTWDKFETNTGKQVSILHFGQPAPWEQSFLAGPLDLITARGAIPLMDMGSDSEHFETHVSLQDIVEGKRDADLKEWSKAVASYAKPFFFRWNWEMNGTWYVWGKEAAANPTVFREAWQRFRKIADEEGATNLTWVWCPNTSFSGSTSLTSLYPGDPYVDWTCIDGYNRGTNPINPEGWKSFSQVFSTTYNELLVLAPSKPIMIGETASTEMGGSKAAWITNAVTNEIPNLFPQIKAVNWFNWNIVEGKKGLRWDWPIESSTSAESAFTSAITSPYYAANTFGSLPKLTRIQALP